MDTTYTFLLKLAYLVAAILFILGLKKMAHPRTAMTGNRLGAVGMLLAILVTLIDPDIKGYGLITLGIVVGGVIGAAMAKRIQMTEMPQLVALFNGLGGGASVLVAGAALWMLQEPAATDVMLATAASGIIGAVTFWGSLVAFGKLQGLNIFKKPLASTANRSSTRHSPACWSC